MRVTRTFYRSAGLFLCLLFPLTYAWPDMVTPPDKNDKSPSKDQVMWTQTDVAYDFVSEYDYVAPSSVDFGSGHAGHLSEQYTDFRHVMTRRTWLAFLWHAGVEWQRTGFNGDAPHTLPIPQEMDIMNLYLATDFRWSDRDMIRLQAQPGFYTDLESVDGKDINTPMAIAYTRIPSKTFQWAVGLSINTLRKQPYLPGGGFRWQLNDRWKLKFMLPTPQVEYKASDVLHVWIGADLRGDTYRVGPHFGDDHGSPTLNNAIVDYEEIRSGTGFSWNIKPLVELNCEAGYLMQRQFDYHNNGISAGSQPAPYINISLRILFQLLKDERPMDQQIRQMQIEFPSLNTFFKIP